MEKTKLTIDIKEEQKKAQEIVRISFADEEYDMNYIVEAFASEIKKLRII